MIINKHQSSASYSIIPGQSLIDSQQRILNNIITALIIISILSKLYQVQFNYFFILLRIINIICMGNIIDSISQNKSTFSCALSTAAILAFIIKDAVQKRNLRNKVLQALDNQLKSKKQNINEVYLSQPVKHYWLKNNPKYPVYKIVLTGGPCGGKSSSFDKLRQVFSQKGFRVLCVPQINTLVVLGGASGLIPNLTNQQLLRYEALLIKFQIFAEDYFTKLAQMADQPAIILCDRGTADAYAYMTDEGFQAILDQQGWSWVTLRDKRYDLVCFLSSAANGAQKFYTLSNNSARSQGLQLARKLDKRTLQAWTGHPHVSVAPNLPNQTFSDKINRVVQAVRNMVGQQLQTLVNHKILIKQPNFPSDIKYESSEIQEIFLLIDDPRCKQNKLKKRGFNYSNTYYQKFIFKTDKEDYTQQLRRQLIPKQYMALKQTKSDKSYNPVVRERIDFIWNNFSYCIDIYNNVAGQEKVYLLRFYARKGQSANFIPPFIEVIRDVYNQKQFKLKTIAQKKIVSEQIPRQV